MSELVASRQQALLELGALKRSIALPPEVLRRMDRTLVERWNIDFVSTQAPLLEYLEQLPMGQAKTLGLKAFHADVATRTGTSGEQHMYEAMAADPELCGIVTSSRRHYLLDAVALACALYGKLGLSGPVLDVGCHVGVASELMAEALSVPVIGLEPVAVAVEAARHLLRARTDVSFVRGAVPWATDARFQMVTAIDCMPGRVGDRAVFLRGLSQLLEPGGLAVVVSATWIDADVTVLRRQLETAGLGFGLADVVGGYGGMPTVFGTEGCVCLVKGGKQPFPRKAAVAMESEWDWFKDYANSPATLPREKTQAFMRSAMHLA